MRTFGWVVAIVVGGYGTYVFVKSDTGYDPVLQAELDVMPHRMLIAGVGNIFLGDDGFGVEVARRLASETLPDWVRVADYGIRSLHLAYELLGGEYTTTVLVDATSRGGAPGTVYPDRAGPRAPEQRGTRSARHESGRRFRVARFARRRAGARVGGHERRCRWRSPRTTMPTDQSTT